MNPSVADVISGSSLILRHSLPGLGSSAETLGLLLSCTQVVAFLLIGLLKYAFKPQVGNNAFIAQPPVLERSFGMHIAVGPTTIVDGWILEHRGWVLSWLENATKQEAGRVGLFSRMTGHGVSQWT